MTRSPAAVAPNARQQTVPPQMLPTAVRQHRPALRRQTCATVTAPDNPNGSMTRASNHSRFDAKTDRRTR